MDLSKFTIPQLRKLLKIISIPGMKKPQLIELATPYMRPPPRPSPQSLRQIPRIRRFQRHVAAHPNDLSFRAALERALAHELRPSQAQSPTRLAPMKHKLQRLQQCRPKPQHQPRSPPLTQSINRHRKQLNKLH